MNANELADYLDNNVEAMIMSEQPYIDQAATMLRQQQAEIEALKKEAALQRLSDFTQEADNEPVAWMRLTGDRVTRITLEKVQDSDIPLYTHPAKTLTDEEIEELAFEYLEKTDKGIVGVYDFVRAILQKASNG